MEFSDIATENNVIACLLKGEDAWLRLPDGIGEEDFTSPLLQGIFIVTDHLFGEGAKIDWVTISQRLPDNLKKDLKGVGDWAYLQTLKDLPIDPGNIELEAKKLKELTVRRRMHKAGQTIAEIASDKGQLDYLLAKIEEVIADIPQDTSSDVFPIGKFAQEWVDEKKSHPQEVPGLPSGFPILDKLVGGFQPGRLYITAARMKVGKSVLLLNWAKNLAVENKEPVLWISTEHSWDIEWPRLLSMVSEVPVRIVDRGLFAGNLLMEAKVEDAVEQIIGSPFHFTYMPDFSLSKIRRVTRKYAKVHGVKACFFDYIKTPAEESALTEWQELGRFTFGLKALAEKHKVSLLTAVQINRIGENLWREDGEMSFAQVAGSDRIGHAMDYGMILRPLNKKERERAGFAGENARILDMAETRHGVNYRHLLNFNSDIVTLKEAGEWIS